MADILKLSNREPDLLDQSEVALSSTKNADHNIPVVVTAKPSDGPQNKTAMSTHELQTDLSRMKKTVNQYVEEKRLLGGNGLAEQMINELYAASQINRGPQGAFPSSRLHLDMLLGRDERITPADYLNFNYNF
uniref:Uncharacterized protein n=1 Tax=Panagrolaimus sp. JU765 TaxID=591449 RepID=A0AC34R1N7_9BILA